MSRNVRAANYILALVALYFVGPLLIWGSDGLAWAVFVMLGGIVLAMIWCVIYAILEINND